MGRLRGSRHATAGETPQAAGDVINQNRASGNRPDQITLFSRQPVDVHGSLSARGHVARGSTWVVLED
jgi:hypothetical protein